MLEIERVCANCKFHYSYRDTVGDDGCTCDISWNKGNKTTHSLSCRSSTDTPIDCPEFVEEG